MQEMHLVSYKASGKNCANAHSKKYFNNSLNNSVGWTVHGFYLQKLFSSIGRNWQEKLMLSFGKAYF